MEYFYYKYSSASFKKIAKKVLNETFYCLLIAPIFYDDSISFLKEIKEDSSLGVLIFLLEQLFINTMDAIIATNKMEDLNIFIERICDLLFSCC